MRYEIGNPSDKCWITAEDDRVAGAAILFLGNGQYFAIPEEGEKRDIPTFFALGGDVDATCKDALGITLTAFLEPCENREKIAACLDTFEYAGERSSLNNIGQAAKAHARALRARLAEAKP